MIIYLAKFMKKKENMKNVKMYQRAVNGGYNPARYNLARGYRDGLDAAKDEQTLLLCSLRQPKREMIMSV